jgi:hypothetical protein
VIYFENRNSSVRTAEIDDVCCLKDTLRESDREEIKASHGHNPEEALLHSLKVSSHAFTVTFKGRPVAMFGVAPTEGDKTLGCIWLLASDEIHKIKKTFLKMSGVFIKQMLDLYPVLFNYVDIRNTKSIDWLKWCGAQFMVPEVYGVENKFFSLFTIRRNADV